MESETLKIVSITIAAVVVVELIVLYLRSIFLKYTSGFEPLFNPFERRTEWSNSDWIDGELYGRASTIEKYGLTKYCADKLFEFDAITEIKRWEKNREIRESLYGSKSDVDEVMEIGTRRKEVE